MQNIIASFIAFLFLVSCTSSVAQDKAQKVQSIVYEVQEYDWYVQQHQLWKDALNENPNNPDGWLNYYTATRMARMMDEDDDRRADWTEKMDQLVEDMKTAISAKTYEYHFIQGYHELDQIKKMPHISKAYEIDPERTDAYDLLVSFYEITRNKVKLKEIAKKWVASGDYSLGTMLANYNVLASTTPNAILVTYGDNDTYPALLLQQSEDFRTDVTVVNLSFLQMPEYRDLIFKEMNIPLLKDPRDSKTVIDHLIKHRGERDLYLGLSAHSKEWDLSDNLCNVGVALMYCELEQQTLPHLVHNYENNLLLDHLNNDFYPEKYPSIAARFTKIYVPGLIMLYEHYVSSNNEHEQQKIRKILVHITKDWEQHGAILEKLEYYKSKTTNE